MRINIAHQIYMKIKFALKGEQAKTSKEPNLDFVMIIIVEIYDLRRSIYLL
jgi:hypothetical protein